MYLLFLYVMYYFEEEALFLTQEGYMQNNVTQASKHA